ncbi:MAG: hypothetical protein Hyperionvirus3_86 [Hyperionvirus sp.]|uniref:Chromosome condensation regulator n=1 Tax=Hyperionvirus sp. TaxID=2487770 RepID=A0A3G5A6Q6_9VIRU|nr:MAG: hypothetical protein Hyperionvirus3_86 [Hyperionvirus sp.]
MDHRKKLNLEHITIFIYTPEKNTTNELDSVALFRNFIPDIQYIIISYYHDLIHILPRHIKHDWFRLLRENYAQTYSKDVFSNDDLNQIFIQNCRDEKKNIIIRRDMMLIRVDPRTIIVYRISQTREIPATYHELVCLGPVEYPADIIRFSCENNYLIIQSTHTIVKAEISIWDTLKLSEFKEIRGIPMNIAEMNSADYQTLILLTDGRLMLFCCRSGDLWRVKNLPGKVVKIACGTSHAAILLDDGRLMTGGTNLYGQLGRKSKKIGPVMSELFDFREVVNIPGNIVNIVCTFHNTFVLFSDGVLMGCGNNSWCQMGRFPRTNVDTFEIITGLPKNIASINGGNCYTVIQLTDGILLYAGYNENHIMAIKHENFIEKFSPMGNPEQNLGQVICGHFFLVIQQNDTNLVTHGINHYEPNTGDPIKFRLL